MYFAVALKVGQPLVAVLYIPLSHCITLEKSFYGITGDIIVYPDKIAFIINSYIGLFIITQPYLNFRTLKVHYSDMSTPLTWSPYL